MWIFNYTDELYHHGVKGMKWGQRRYQNKDGSLTNAGKKRYSEPKPTEKKKSKHRQELEEKYKSFGFSSEEAAKKANTRIRTEKILAVTAGVTVAACAAYAVHKSIKYRTDQIIKSGDMMQRIESEKKLFGSKDSNLHEAFYATNNAYDNRNYYDAFGSQKQMYYNKAYEMNIKAVDDIKIASQKKARDTFGELLKDEEFVNTIYVHNVDRDLRGEHKLSQKVIDKIANGDKISKRLLGKLYDNYNSNLVGKPLDEEVEAVNRQMFYDALKKKGYGGIQDINDLKWSHLRGKNPLIIFDKSKVSVSSMSRIKEPLVLKGEEAYKRMNKLVVGQRLMNEALPTAAVGLTAAAGATYLVDPKKPKKQKSKK